MPSICVMFAFSPVRDLTFFGGSVRDNATRNAGDMIERLTIEFNRTRQAVITNELIEIISGAEAL